MGAPRSTYIIYKHTVIKMYFFFSPSFPNSKNIRTLFHKISTY